MAYLRAEVEDQNRLELVVDLSHDGGREQSRRAARGVEARKAIC